MVMYASPRSIGSPRIVLLPGVNFYPSLFSMFSLPAVLAYAWCARACGGAMRGSFPLSVVWAFPCWSRCLFRACVFFSSPCRSFLSFWSCSVVSLASSCVVWSVGSVSFLLSLSLSLLAPCCASVGLPWALGAPDTNSFNSHEYKPLRHSVIVIGLH